jgi:hypothetical protein
VWGGILLKLVGQAKNEDMIRWNATLLRCLADVLEFVLLGNDVLGARDGEMVDEFGDRIGGIGAADDAAGANGP